MFRACLISLVLLSAAMPALAQTNAAAPVSAKPAATAHYVKPLPPGKLVDIGGRHLHIQCKGNANQPTVIFEAGLSQWTAHSTYSKAQDLIAPFARVCVYDRAGLGWSDPVRGARTQQEMIEDLHKLVTAMHFTSPLVLVGHSIGGLLTRRYAKDYPSEVAGMVLVDSSPLDIIYAPDSAQARNAMIAKIDAGLKQAKLGVPVVPMPAGTPAETMMAFTPRILRTVRQEYEAIDLVPAVMKVPEGYGTLGDMPLAVIRRGKTDSPPSMEDKQWRDLQEATADLSTRSFLVVATESGHVIPYEQPAIVASAVRRVLGEIGKQ